MHQPSVSTCSLSPRCGSARRAATREEASSRPATGRSGRRSRPQSSNYRNELFYLTRPPSGGVRQLSMPLFVEDVEAQRSRMGSARVQRPSENHQVSCEEKPCPEPEVPHSRKSPVPFCFDQPFVFCLEDPNVEVFEPRQPMAPAQQPQSSSSLAPMSILHELRTHRVSARRPSRLPTPPPPPSLEDLIGGGRRRASLFPQRPMDDEGAHATPQKEYMTGSTECGDTSDFGNVDLADARTGFQEHQLRNSFDETAKDANNLPTSTRDYDATSSLSPEQARKRAFYAKMNDVIAVTAGVQLMIPFFPSMPHYQTLHPLDLSREVSTAELPYSLRVGHGATSHAPTDERAKGPHNENRGFMTIAQWRREGRSSNFVMPTMSNPGPVAASVAALPPRVGGRDGSVTRERA